MDSKGEKLNSYDLCESNYLSYVGLNESRVSVSYDRCLKVLIRSHTGKIIVNTNEKNSIDTSARKLRSFGGGVEPILKYALPANLSRLN